MNTLFSNHKSQAFYLTFLFFMPLVVFIFYTANFLKMELKTQEQFSLAINQFVMQQNLVSTPVVEPQAFTPPKEPLVKKKTIKKVKEIRKTQAKSPQPLIQPQPQNNTAHIAKEQPKPDIENLTYGKDDNPFLRQIKQAIDNARIYPRQARKMRMQGQVLVEFLWKENKILDELKILKSSGYKILDESALEAIQIASANFPKYDKNIRIKIPIAYNLKKF